MQGETKQGLTQGITQIITPEGVELTFETAGIGRRALALAIDSCIQYTAIILLFILLFNTTDFLRATAPNAFFRGTRFWVGALLPLALFAITSLYFVILELFMQGRTPGKAIMRLRVMQKNGAPAGVGALLVRNLLRIVDSLPIFYAVGIVSTFCTKNEQRLGDLVAGTIVVSESRGRGVRGDAPFAVQPLLDDLSDIEITAQEFELLESYVARSKKLQKRARMTLEDELEYYFVNKYRLQNFVRDECNGVYGLFLSALYWHARRSKDVPEE